MKKLVALAVVALVGAVPAAADNGASAKGTIVAVSATRISVKDARGVVLTCNVGPHSPSLSGYSAGDSVALACAGPKGRLVLAKVRHLTGGAPSQSDQKPVTFAGAVTALGNSSVSLRDGDRDLTCTFDSSSPALTGVSVGRHIKVTCVNGVLTAWAPVAPPAGRVGRTAAGTLSALDSSSLTVRSDDGDLTCTLGPSSPATASFKVGDRVKVGCVDGVLVAIVNADGGGSGGGHVTRGALGTLTALSATSVTVHTDGGDVTCTLGPSSPSTAGLALGDPVKMGCLDGVVVGIAKADSPPPPPPSNAQTAAGTITSLSDASITVQGEQGDLTCTRGSASPALGDHRVGDRVGIACVDGALAKIVRLR